MNPDDLRARFAALQVWETKGQRAPNKPLLALWAIGRCFRDEERMASYRDAERALAYLLSRFGPPRKRAHPEFSFWRMRNDSLWEVQGTGPITERRSGPHLPIAPRRGEVPRRWLDRPSGVRCVGSIDFPSHATGPRSQSHSARRHSTVRRSTLFSPP